MLAAAPWLLLPCAALNPLRQRRDIDTLKSFGRWLEVSAMRRPSIDELKPTLISLASACRSISLLVRNAPSFDLDGMFTSGEDGDVLVNVQGEDVKKLDVVTNRILKAALCASGGVSCVASEEEDVPQLCSSVLDNALFTGKYAVVFDPLDGSANIDVGLSAGTIFGIYRRPHGCGADDAERQILQPGSELCAAGYCLYGSSTTLVLTVGQGMGVHGFCLDDTRGEFVLRHEAMRVPARGCIYSFNEGNFMDWLPPVQEYVKAVKAGNGQTGRRYTARYQGALAADAHNILMRGGIFGYPGSASKPNGKLRLVYEANPMSFLMEEAGGAGSTGVARILDLPPNAVHQRVPFFLGSREDVLELEAHLAGWDGR